MFRKWSHSSFRMDKTSTQSQTHTGPARKVYSFTSQTAVLPETDAVSDGVRANIRFLHPKLSELVLHVTPNVWKTLLRRGLRL